MKGCSAGFTLLETVMAAGIALIVGTFLVAILVSHSGLFYKQSSIVNEGLNLNDAMREIENNIRQAVYVADGYPEGSPDYTTGVETLVLKLPALSETGVVDGIYDYAVVAKDSSEPKVVRLWVFPDPQSTRKASNLVLTNLLESVQFKFLDKSGNLVAPTSAASVGTTLTVLSKTGSIGSSRSSSAITTLRNFSP